MPSQSMLDLVSEQVQARPDQTAALCKREGQYQAITWAQLWSDAERVAQALCAIGIATNDHVNIVSNTRYEWVTLDLGILGAGAVTVPIYPSNLADECLYVCEHSGARLVFCEDSSQVEKFLAIREQLPQVIKVVQMTGEVEGADDWVISMADFLAPSVEVEGCTLDERRAALGPESILTIIYTSGTTGRPKGVVLTHANMIYEAEAIRQVGVIEPADVQLLFLPLAHSFARVLATGWIATGHVLAFAESMSTVKENLGEVRPTIMAGVPRVFEKFYAAVVDKGLSASGLKRKLFTAALELSSRHGELELEGKQLGLLDSIKFELLKTLVFAKVHEGVMAILGGRMRLMVSGGAPLPLKIAWFFRDAEIVVLEGYGLTETSAATTVNLPGHNQIGTVGPPLPGTEAKIAEDGEILLKGPGIMREYWRNPEATAESLVDGWFHTGDIGAIDERTGALRITDRKKDLIITAGGKNVAPQRIENLVKSDGLISQCVVHGDRRKFLSALLTLDEAALHELASSRGLDGDYPTLARHPEVRAVVEDIVARANKELASYETIKKFEILDHDFSIETGELTPKLSVKRKLVNSKYGHIFDGFYED
ncbi:MAG: long-chain fatty acid--CoA ligase [Enhygromyxa sp.]